MVEEKHLTYAALTPEEFGRVRNQIEDTVRPMYAVTEWKLSAPDWGGEVGEDGTYLTVAGDGEWAGLRQFVLVDEYECDTFYAEGTRWGNLVEALTQIIAAEVAQRPAPTPVATPPAPQNAPATPAAAANNGNSGSATTPVVAPPATPTTGQAPSLTPVNRDYIEYYGFSDEWFPAVQEKLTEVMERHYPGEWRFISDAFGDPDLLEEMEEEGITWTPGDYYTSIQVDDINDLGERETIPVTYDDEISVSFVPGSRFAAAVAEVLQVMKSEHDRQMALGGYEGEFFLEDQERIFDEDEDDV